MFESGHLFIVIWDTWICRRTSVINSARRRSPYNSKRGWKIVFTGATLVFPNNRFTSEVPSDVRSRTLTYRAAAYGFRSFQGVQLIHLGILVLACVLSSQSILDSHISYIKAFASTTLGPNQPAGSKSFARLALFNLIWSWTLKWNLSISKKSSFNRWSLGKSTRIFFELDVHFRQGNLAPCKAKFVSHSNSCVVVMSSGKVIIHVHVLLEDPGG